MALAIFATIVTILSAVIPSRIISKLFRRRTPATVQPETTQTTESQPDQAEKQARPKGIDTNYVKFMLSKTTILRLLKLNRRNYINLILLNVMGFSSTYASSVIPLKFTRCLDALKEEDAEDKLYARAMEFLLMTAFSAFLICAKSLFQNVVIKASDRAVQLHLYEDILGKDLSFFENKYEQTTLLTDVNASFGHVVQYSSLQPYIDLVQSIFRLCLSVSILWKASPQLSLCVLVLAPFVTWVSQKLIQYSNEIQRDLVKNQGFNTNILNQSINNIRLVKSFSTEEHCLKTLADSYAKRAKLEFKVTLIQSFSNGFSTIAGKISEILVVLVGGKMALQGQITVGEIPMFLTYAKSVSGYLNTFNTFFVNLSQGGFYVHRAFEFIDYVPKVNAKGGEKPETLEGCIEFKNVNFRYPGREDAHVSKDLNFKISPGEVVAFAGPSGSGKSTVVTLLTRLYDPIEGSIFIDGKDLKTIDLPWFHRRVGIVSQEPALLPGTIEENIAYGIENYTQEQMDTVCELANVKEFVSNPKLFPKGMKTQVGDRGLKLSGGQKQRIAIARALIRNPSILIFDEATSALDAESEHQVQKAIDRLIGEGKCTMIIIAHRLSTIINCNRIYAMKAGEIKEFGSHQELMSQAGVYRELFERQVAGFEGQITSKDAKGQKRGEENDKAGIQGNRNFGSLRVGKRETRVKESPNLDDNIITDNSNWMNDD